jgi:hypothetical protein
MDSKNRTARPVGVPQADWTLWASMPTWALWEGVALSIDAEPVSRRSDLRAGLPFDADLYGPEFERRLRIAAAHVDTGYPVIAEPSNYTPVHRLRRAHFARWAKQQGWPVPEPMERISAGEPLTGSDFRLSVGSWTLHEAAHLLVGLVPVPSDEFDVHERARGPEQTMYARLKAAVLDTHELAASEPRDRSRPTYMLCRVVAADVVRWALEKGWDVPAVLAGLAESETEEQRESEEPATEADSELALLFDPVPVEWLATTFPTHSDREKSRSKWEQFAERAARNGLKAAREGRGLFNPYKAGMFFVRQGVVGWNHERVMRVLARNLPPRSADQAHLFTGELP